MRCENWKPVTSRQSPIDNHQLPVAGYRLPATGNFPYLQPVTCNLQPVTCKSQPPPARSAAAVELIRAQPWENFQSGLIAKGFRFLRCKGEVYLNGGQPLFDGFLAPSFDGQGYRQMTVFACNSLKIGKSSLSWLINT
jgi:hypothetical protein